MMTWARRADGSDIYTRSCVSVVRFNQWPSETFIVDAGEQRPAWAVFAELRPPRLMEMRFLLNTGELLLRPSHWRIDRARCLLLMDRFFDIMASEQTASPAWGEEMFRLPPALEDALQLPRRPRSIRNGARSGFLTLGRRRRPSVFLVV
ncbi:NAD dependent epimerase/dehydratase [Colletotrichum higginsianum]|nr:NAD dependent epimerase/dehydratase [Colletotrichum higginsianum]